MRVDGETRGIGLGDVAVIVPGQRHAVWQQGEADLVMLVTCVPAYLVEEVVFKQASGLPARCKADTGEAGVPRILGDAHRWPSLWR